MSLSAEFDKLAQLLEQLIAILEEAEDTFWCAYLKRGLSQVQAHKLSGATFVLGCYAGAESFSDLVLAQQLQETDRLRFDNLNNRFGHLRTAVFESANLIASRRLW